MKNKYKIKIHIAEWYFPLSFSTTDYFDVYEILCFTIHKYKINEK